MLTGPGPANMLKCMFRVVITSLLIVALLLCPFNCMGALTSLVGAAQTERTIAKVCCGCHSHACNVADKAAPDSPVPETKNNCGCVTCLCQGAVLSEISSLDIKRLQIWMHPPRLRSMDRWLLDGSLYPLERWTGCRQSGEHYGRFARIVFGSFLI